MLERLSSDSRRCAPGVAFFSYPGERADGREHIADAIARGAAAVVWEAEGYAWRDAWRLPNAAVRGLKPQAGALAHAFYGKPSAALWTCGVTGTNGKTTCTQWIAAILDRIGAKCGVVGTLGAGLRGALEDAGNTTPDALELHRLLAAMRRDGAEAVAMEVSSHGLDQGRVNGVEFDCALFTNLSRDHLDYHGSMQAYAAAKAVLFEAEGLECAVLNLDDAFGLRLAARLRERGVRTIGYSLAPEAAASAGVPEYLAVSRIEPGTLHLASSWGAARTEFHPLGHFNVANALGVLGCLLVHGMPYAQAVAALAELPALPGRMQRIGDTPLAVVDYAHSPDALEKALQALRPVAAARGGRLIAVFGAGGDRDRGKRAPMGEVASRLADRVVLTSDNPRSEDPLAIIRDIEPGVGAPHEVQADRARAIESAIAQAADADVVLISGKGHESWQESGGQRLPFSDAAVARAALERRGGAMMSLAEAAAAMQGRLAGPDARFRGVSTDSRSLRAGELFVAIRGEHFDGHEFIDTASERGASAALVDERFTPRSPLPVVIVDDTRKALGRLGRYWRQRFAPVVIGIAGANGKTTTKEMLASILRAHAGEAAVLATKGNLNTDIGVPMTLLQLGDAHRYCAIELGTNHPGEIEWLAGIARPTIALITNAQREHMEFLKSVEASARENASVFHALPASGVAVVNADDACRPIFLQAAGPRQVVEFGLEREATVSGGTTLRQLSSEIVLRTPAGEARASLAIPGLHNVRNALAAAACAHAAGIPVETIGRGLEAFRPYAGRLQVKRTKGGATLLDDSYNANPDSVRAAIDVLAACPAPAALVLGDMGEVGEQGPALHREVGAYARSRGIGALYALGEASREAVKAFGAGARHFTSPEELIEALPRDVTLLVKGSRFMRMERVVAALTGENQGAH